MPIAPNPPLSPLPTAAHDWEVVSDASSLPVGVVAPAIVSQVIQELLSQLSTETFESISTQIVAWTNKSEHEHDGRTLRQVLKLIFERAIDDAPRSEMYARLCRKMMDTLSDKVSDEKVVDSKGALVTGGSLFRKFLLKRCQEDFEVGWTAWNSTLSAARSSTLDDKTNTEARSAEALASDEDQVAQTARRRGLGLVRFVGEIFKLEIFTERIMHDCVKRLLANVVTPEEEDIESLCQLLTTVGQVIDSPQAKTHVDVYFLRINQLRNHPVVSSRLKDMLLEVIELRSRHWEERDDTQEVQTLPAVGEQSPSVVRENTQPTSSVSPVASSMIVSDAEALGLIVARISVFFSESKDLDSTVAQLQQLSPAHLKIHGEKLVAYALTGTQEDLDIALQLLLKASVRSALPVETLKAGIASMLEHVQALQQARDDHAEQVARLQKTTSLFDQLVVAAGINREDLAQ